MEEYKSVEQRIFERFSDTTELVKEVVEGFSYTFPRSLYGTFVTPLRIPTFIRKLRNKQILFLSRRSREILDNLDDGGSLFGLIFGSVGAVGTYALIISKAVESGNYAPLIIAGVTNLASGMYELGRLSNRRTQSIKENHSLERTVTT